MAHISRRAVLASGAALLACGPLSAMTGGFTETTVEVEGIPIHLAGSGRGRPIVLIHGASGNLNDMTFRLGPALRDRFQVIAVDRPGHGRSGLPPGGGVSINRQALLIREALTRVGVKRPIVLGHSYGGSVALAWALDAPDTLSGLVLLAAPSQVWDGGLGITNEFLANPLTGPVLAATIPHLVTPGFATKTLAEVFVPQSPPAGYLAHLDLRLVLQPSSLRENARQLVALKEELRPMIPRYPSLTLPIELVHGDADRTVGLQIHSEPFVDQVPHARLTVLPGIGHMLHQVATEAVVRRINALAR